MGLNTRDIREQQIANSLINNFNKSVFQQKLVTAVVVENLPFSIVESTYLRDLLEYCNPLVKNTEALVTRKTIRAQAVRAYETYRQVVIENLHKVHGKIHVAFDGWRSSNRLSLYGIVIFYLDEQANLEKLVLDMPEISDRHTAGENIATHVAQVLKTFEITQKIGYFSLDNATNNDTAM